MDPRRLAEVAALQHLRRPRRIDRHHARLEAGPDDHAQRALGHRVPIRLHCGRELARRVLAVDAPAGLGFTRPRRLGCDGHRQRLHQQRQHDDRSRRALQHAAQAPGQPQRDELQALVAPVVLQLQPEGRAGEQGDHQREDDQADEPGPAPRRPGVIGIAARLLAQPGQQPQQQREEQRREEQAHLLREKADHAEGPLGPGQRRPLLRGIAQGREVVLQHPCKVRRENQRSHRRGQHDAPARAPRRQLAGQHQRDDDAGQGHHRLILRQHRQARGDTGRHPPAPQRRLQRVQHAPGGGADREHHHGVVVEQLRPRREGLLQAPQQQGQRGERRAEQAPRDRVGEPGRARRAQAGQHIGPVRRRPEHVDGRSQQPGRQRRMLVVAPLEAVRPDELLEVIAPLRGVDARTKRHPRGDQRERQPQRPRHARCGEADFNGGSGGSERRGQGIAL